MDREYASLLDILGELRGQVTRMCPPDKRRELWYQLIDSDLLELLREGKAFEARQRAENMVTTCLEESHER